MSIETCYSCQYFSLTTEAFNEGTTNLNSDANHLSNLNYTPSNVADNALGSFNYPAGEQSLNSDNTISLGLVGNTVNLTTEAFDSSALSFNATNISSAPVDGVTVDPFALTVEDPQTTPTGTAATPTTKKPRTPSVSLAVNQIDLTKTPQVKSSFALGTGVQKRPYWAQSDHLNITSGSGLGDGNLKMNAYMQRAEGQSNVPNNSDQPQMSAKERYAEYNHKQPAVNVSINNAQIISSYYNNKSPSLLQIALPAHTAYISEHPIGGTPKSQIAYANQVNSLRIAAVTPSSLLYGGGLLALSAPVTAPIVTKEIISEGASDLTGGLSDILSLRKLAKNGISWGKKEFTKGIDLKNQYGIEVSGLGSNLGNVKIVKKQNIKENQAEIVIPDKSPDFIVSPNGTAFPVPKGAKGPIPVINSKGKTTGIAFTGGKGGKNGQVDTIRIMNPAPARGKTPSYPNGYIKYQNKSK